MTWTTAKNKCYDYNDRHIKTATVSIEQLIHEHLNPVFDKYPALLNDPWYKLIAPVHEYRASLYNTLYFSALYGTAGLFSLGNRT